MHNRMCEYPLFCAEDNQSSNPSDFHARLFFLPVLSATTIRLRLWAKPIVRYGRLQSFLAWKLIICVLNHMFRLNRLMDGFETRDHSYLSSMASTGVSLLLIPNPCGPTNDSQPIFPSSYSSSFVHDIRHCMGNLVS